MIPPKVVKLEDKKAEKVVKELMEDIYNQLTSISKNVKTVETTTEKNTLITQSFQTVAASQGGFDLGKDLQLVDDLYIDQYDESFTERNAVFTIAKLISTCPVGVYYTSYVTVEGLGNNTNKYGVGAGYFGASDKSDVAAGTKGVLEGGRFEVGPIVDRASLGVDDVVGVAIRNKGTKKGTFGLVIEDNAGVIGSQWLNSFRIMGDADSIGYVEGVFTNGIDFSNSTITNGVILLPNNKWITGENAAGGTFLKLISMDGSNNISFYDGVMTLTSAGILSIESDLKIASGHVVKVNAVQVVGTQQTAVADASTGHAITDPGDAPATADALRDDLEANTIPSIETALDNLGTKVNSILSRLRTHGLIAT